MKGGYWLQLLRYIDKGSKRRRPANFLEAFLMSSKADYRAIQYYEPSFNGPSAETINRRSLNRALYQLRSEGLLVRKKNWWKLSTIGKQKLIQLLRRQKHFLPKPEYQTFPGQEVIIISYDVPEQKGCYRRWLHTALKNMKFQPVHKSVWAGRRKLPDNFLGDLSKFELLDHVMITAVTRTGTLKKIV
jgi:hypothetical protein